MIVIRQIKRTDLNDDLFSLLAQLSGKLGEYDIDKLWSRYTHSTNQSTFVDEVKEAGKKTRIIATSSVLIESKFLHCGSKVGHIEDVVVCNDARGAGLGQKIVQHCIDYARDAGCYKVILDCSNDNVPFYINCGMYLSENCMRIDL
jgi:glucosamine-phosphate N-acetyltransferase